MNLSPENDIALRATIKVYDAGTKKMVPVTSGSAEHFISKTKSNPVPSHEDLVFTPTCIDTAKGWWLIAMDATDLPVDTLMTGPGAFVEDETGYIIVKIAGAIRRAIPFTFKEIPEDAVEESE